MRPDRGTVVLGCEDSEPTPCCLECHARLPTKQLELMGGSTMIIVRPPPPVAHQEWGADWTLHIRAEVCCKHIDWILRQPHEWWVEQAKKFDSAKVHYDHFYRTSSGPFTPDARKKPLRQVTNACKSCGSKLKNPDVCDNCGSPQ